MCVCRTITRPTSALRMASTTARSMSSSVQMATYSCNAKAYDCDVFSSTCKYIWKEGTRIKLNSGKLTDEQYGHVLAVLPPHQRRLCLVMYACIAGWDYSKFFERQGVSEGHFCKWHGPLKSKTHFVISRVTVKCKVYEDGSAEAQKRQDDLEAYR